MKNMDLASLALGGSDSPKAEVPKKEIKHMLHRKSSNGKHIVEHHHTHPEHHPMEEHVMNSMDDVHDHMEDTMGTPNPGEAEADNGQAGEPMPEQGA